MIEFVFAYASEEWDRDRLAVTIAAYDEHGHVLVTETQQTEDLRSRTPTEPVVFVPVAIVGSSSNQVQVLVHHASRRLLLEPDRSRRPLNSNTEVDRPFSIKLLTDWAFLNGKCNCSASAAASSRRFFPHRGLRKQLV